MRRAWTVALGSISAALAWHCGGSTGDDAGSAAAGGFGGVVLPSDAADTTDEPELDAGTEAEASVDAPAPNDASDAAIDWILVDTPREITEPGHYRVTQDLGANDSVIDMHDTEDVVLDCDGHVLSSSATTVGAIHVENVDGFTIQNCKLLAGIQDLKTYGLWIAGSSNGQIDHNEIRASNVTTSQKLVVEKNTLTQYYQQYESTECVVKENLIYGDPEVTIPATIIFGNGGKNQALDNQIDGKWNGDPSSTLAADDGVVLHNEASDLVAGNLILNVWDCGLETTGWIEDTTFQNNVMAHSNYCCVGAWHWNSWRNNRVLGNTCHDVGSMFAFMRYHGLAEGETSVYFQDNEFTGNVQTSGGWENISRIDFQNLPPELPAGVVVVGNNLMKDNAFTFITPFLFPASMFVDGGGNQCPKGTDPSFPLSCGKP